MGKTGAISWFRAVKRAFEPAKKGTGRKGEQEKEPHKKREKRRWIFSRPSPHERKIEHKETKTIASPRNARIPSRKSFEKLETRSPLVKEEAADADKKRAFAVARATAAATKAAIATAQAAMEVIRLTTPSLIVAEHYAAVKIQSAFRGYLARKALQALKGVVKLQAFVRGYIVRKRAKMTLQCMQSLLRVQSQVCDQRKRLSTDSEFSPLKHFYQVTEMKSDVSNKDTKLYMDNRVRKAPALRDLRGSIVRNLPSVSRAIVSKMTMSQWRLTCL